MDVNHNSAFYLFLLSAGSVESERGKKRPQIIHTEREHSERERERTFSPHDVIYDRRPHIFINQ